MSTPTVDEFEECCGYTCQHETSEQHYIVTKKDLTTYGQSRYEEGVKAGRARAEAQEKYLIATNPNHSKRTGGLNQ